jgi:hypothetical protein
MFGLCSSAEYHVCCLKPEQEQFFKLILLDNRKRKGFSGEYDFIIMFVQLEPVVDSKLSQLYQRMLPSKVTGKQKANFQQTANSGLIRKADSEETHSFSEVEISDDYMPVPKSSRSEI